LREKEKHMQFVIRRTDHDGGYVTRPGSAHSYTSKLQEARVYATKATARAECCENEIVLSLESALQAGCA
jgi:hypothetical protein